MAKEEELAQVESVLTAQIVGVSMMRQSKVYSILTCISWCLCLVAWLLVIGFPTEYRLWVAMFGLMFISGYFSGRITPIKTEIVNYKEEPSN